uniref:Uncharacterized protein n=1 Tax=Anguilla anguilla TaxID=7936 RepID=A0A0E9UKT4_ANGAN
MLKLNVTQEFTQARRNSRFRLNETYISEKTKNKIKVAAKRLKIYGLVKSPFAIFE